MYALIAWVKKKSAKKILSVISFLRSNTQLRMSKSNSGSVNTARDVRHYVTDTDNKG